MSGAPGSLPYYGLAVVSHDVAAEIRVNDLPVLRLPSGHVEARFDVNPYMQRGPNTLSLQVRPVGADGFGPRSRCAVDLAMQAGPKDEAGTPLASLLFEAPAPAAGGFMPASLSATQAFDHAAPFGPWSWAQAPELPATEAIRAEVLASYRRIHALLVARDINTLLQACDGQARDWQVAYGLPDLATAQVQLRVAETLADPNIHIEDFPEDVLTLELLGDRRLVQLVDAEGKSPLCLRMASNDAMQGRFNVVLSRTGSTWTIAR